MIFWFHWNLFLPEECPALVAGDRPIVETDLGKDPAHSALALVPVTRHLDCFSKDSETLLINLNCCWTKSSLMGSWQPTKISGSTEQGYGGCKGWRTRKPQGRGGSLWGVGDEAALETLHWGLGGIQRSMEGRMQKSNWGQCYSWHHHKNGIIAYYSHWRV